MRILQINAVYGLGSTGHIVEDIHRKIIRTGNESFVFWGTRTSNHNSNNIIRIGNTLDHKIHAIAMRIDKKQGWHSSRYTEKACNLIKNINPDVVHLHNLHSNYVNLPILLSFLSEYDYPTLVTLHDCWFYTGYCTHYTKRNCNQWMFGCSNCPFFRGRRQASVMKTYLEKENLYRSIKYLSVNGVSNWTTEDARQSILKNASFIETIYNWIDTKVFYPRESRSEIFQEFNLNPKKKLILGVSQAWGPDKGLKEFLKISNVFKSNSYVGLVGDLKGLRGDNNILALGYIRDKEKLAKIYSAADIFVTPSRMETFGLVSAEAQACGTPVVGYDNTGMREVIGKKCGFLVENGNIEEMIEAIRDVLNKPKLSYMNDCLNHILNNFEKDRQIKKYFQLYLKTKSLKNM